MPICAVPICAVPLVTQFTLKAFCSSVYPIVYTSEYLQIGCERHEIKDWREFNDERILRMDGKRALEFWQKWKSFIFTAIEIEPAIPTKTDGDTK